MQMLIAGLIVGVVAGALVGWVLAQAKVKSGLQSELDALRQAAAKASAQAEELAKQVQESQAASRNLQEELAQAREAKARAEAQREEAAKSLAEQRKLLEEAEVRLKDAFSALSAKTLETQQKQFVENAKQQLEQFRKLLQADFGQHKQTVEGLTKPLSELLERYEKELQVMEKNRAEAYGSLNEQVKRLQEAEVKLQQETGKLVQALRQPQVRGRWGELTLHRVVELAGMVEHCDFTEQESTRTDEGKLQRPDMVVHVPGGRQLVVDSKVSLEAYLKALETDDEAERESFLEAHARQLRTQMENLAKKQYWEQLDDSVDLVIMFVPSEVFLNAALQKDPSLLEDGMRNRVVVATPSSLMALLRAVAYGWRQEQLAENAREISKIGLKFYERLCTFLEHFEGVGKGLDTAVKRYDRAVGSLERNLLPSARRFPELGIQSAKTLPDLQPLGHSARKLNAPEANSTPELETPTDET